MDLLEPTQFNDTYALAVTQSFADKYHLKTISDLARVQQYVKAGFDPEFSTIQDGYLGLAKKYGFHFFIVSLDPGVRYAALEKGEVNLVDAYSTDSALQKYHLVVLQDNEHFFPPYQGAPLLRQDTVQEYPQIVPVLDKLSGKITDCEMRKMNYEVDVEGMSPATVAKNFLTASGLLQ